MNESILRLVRLTVASDSRLDYLDCESVNPQQRDVLRLLSRVDNMCVVSTSFIRCSMGFISSLLIANESQTSNSLQSQYLTDCDILTVDHLSTCQPSQRVILYCSIFNTFAHSQNSKIKSKCA
jgi:hypothetical protein